LKSISEIIRSGNKIAICGKYVSRDTIHVGLYWNSEDEQKIFHFLNGNNIPVEDANNKAFNNYLLNPIENFPESLIPTLAAIAELISENKINNLIFNREGVIYNGGKFEFNTGNYNVSPLEKIMNCGVFIIALLNTFDYTLIDWNSWPNQTQTNYLDNWLLSQNIPNNEWSTFYNQAKTIRGKHIIVCPSTNTKPSSYKEAELLAGQLIASM
jgi:hypothetical protein